MQGNGAELTPSLVRPLLVHDTLGRNCVLRYPWFDQVLARRLVNLPLPIKHRLSDILCLVLLLDAHGMISRVVDVVVSYRLIAAC